MKLLHQRLDDWYLEELTLEETLDRLRPRPRPVLAGTVPDELTASATAWGRARAWGQSELI